MTWTLRMPQASLCETVDHVKVEVDPALVGLLVDLPKEGWTEERRAAFLKIFATTLDLRIPILPAATQETRSHA
jgi:hypothetical protein